MPRSFLQKIILRVPYFVEFKVPLVFIAKIKNSAPHLYTQLSKRPVFRYIRQGSAETNHQLISITSYLATTHEDVAFFTKLNKATNCLVDHKLFMDPFYDFAILNGLFLHNVLDLSALQTTSNQTQLAHAKPYSEYQRQILNGAVPFHFCHELLILTVDGLKDGSAPLTLKNTSDKEYTERVLKVWTALTSQQQQSKPLQLCDFPLVSAVFDIEAGSSDNNCDQFITPLSGYVQMIGVSFTMFTNVLDIAQLKNLILVYKKPGLDFASIGKNLPTVFAKLGKIEVVYFETELELLVFFMGVVVPNIDVLEGYNSDQFDIPFIFARHQLISNGKSAYMDPTRQFYLLKYDAPCKLSLQPKYFYHFAVTCQNCSESIELDKCTNQSESMQDLSMIICLFCHQVRANFFLRSIQ